MSAFIVSRAHIALLVQEAIDRRVCWWSPRGGFRVRIDPASPVPADAPPYMARHVDPDSVGQMLWDANLRSIHARYPDTVGNPDRQPGPGYPPVGYVHERPQRTPGGSTHHRWQVLRALDCYEYQSCEVGSKEWRESEAFRFVEGLRSVIWGELTREYARDAEERGRPLEWSISDPPASEPRVVCIVEL